MIHTIKLRNILFVLGTTCFFVVQSLVAYGYHQEKVFKICDSFPISGRTEYVLSETPMIQGELYNLFIDASTFLYPNPRKLVASFTFTTLDTLTLKAWNSRKDDGSEFDPPADFQMFAGLSGGLKFINGTVFGNLVIKKNVVKSIQRYIRDNAPKYLVFKPEFDTDGIHIIYSIHYTNEDPRKVPFSADKFVPSGFSLNPSPPKSY